MRLAAHLSADLSDDVKAAPVTTLRSGEGPQVRPPGPEGLEGPEGQAAVELLSRAQVGDADAFAQIVCQHQRMVFSLAYHFTRDHGAAEDVAQDVFLELYRNLSRLDSVAHVTFWLRRVTSHRCIDRARREGHRLEFTMGDLPESPVPPTVRDPLLQDVLLALVAELPAKPRIVVTLRYQEDLDPPEIAQTLGMPLNTVKSHLRRALAFMRVRLAEREKEL